jgi:membrane protein
MKQKYDRVKFYAGHPHLFFATARDIIWDTIKNYENNGNTNQAAAISLYGILSFIPLFILTMLAAHSIFGSHPDIQRELIDSIQEFNPYFSESLRDQLGQIERKKTVLGWVGIITLIWFSSMIFGAIETAMNTIFRSRKSRNYLVSKLLAISMIPMAWAVGIVSVGVTYVSTILAKQPFLHKKEFLFLSFLQGDLFSYIVPYMATVVFFTIVYKAIPTEKVSLGGALVGAAIFSALMEVAKHFFTWYISHYTRYNIIFGSLEAVVILVVWVFYVALIFLFCAELIASYQRRNLILLEKAFLKPENIGMKTEERLFSKFGREYRKGSYIFREGDTGQEMYYILMGNVRVEKSAGQVTKVLAEMGPGKHFGEMAALIEAPRTASALAIEDSTVAVITGDTFRALLRESSELSLFMLKEFSNRIKHTNLTLEEVTRSWIRLIALLYLLHEWPLPDNQNPLEDLARCMRKHPVEIQQVLWDLRDHGIITISGGKISQFREERAWDLLNEQIFYPERRAKKRELGIHL